MTAHTGKSAPAGRVVLIGGGVTSSLCAIRLAERGYSVTVLEKAAVGNGSSSRSNAGIRAQFGVEETAVGMLYSEWWYSHFHELLKTSSDSAQPVIRQNGYLFLYEDPTWAAPVWQPAVRASAAEAWERAQRFVAMQQRVGVEVDMLEPDEVHRRWPHVDPQRLIGATFCATDGFLEPHIILAEGYRRARELGVHVVTQAEVTGATLQGGRIVSIETTRGSIEADWFVNATNAWAPRVSQRLSGMPLSISPLKRYLYHLRLREPLLSEEAWSRLPMTIYGLGVGRGALSRPDGPLLVLAWAHDAAPEPDFSDEDQDRIDPDFNHEHGLDNFGYAALAQVADFSPQVADAAGISATTSGFYGVTPDNDPLIGHDRMLINLVHAAGFSGHGLMHAPVTAVLVEAIIAGDIVDGRVRLPPPFERHTINLATFDPGRDFASSHKESLVL